MFFDTGVLPGNNYQETCRKLPEAAKTGSPHAEAYAAAVSAEMFAADGQADECRRSLDAEQAAYLRFDAEPSDRVWWQFYDPSYPLTVRSHCAVQLGDSSGALAAVTEALTVIEPDNLCRYAHLKLWQAQALLQHRRQ